MTVTTESPRIYVACLAAYNNGHLHGKWIDADQDADEIYAEIKAMLATSPIPGAEEFAIHDFEGFGDYRLSEYESIEKVASIAEGISEHGLAFAAYMSNDSSADPDDFEEAFCGEWESEKDYAQEYVSDCGWAGLAKIPDELESYLDWDAITDVLMQDYDTFKTPDYKVWIFRSV